MNGDYDRLHSSDAERWEDYVQPGYNPAHPEQAVLKNKLGITDLAELETAEQRYSTARMMLAISRPGHESNEFGLERLRDIHRHLFSDVYTWAGEVRTVNMRRLGDERKGGQPEPLAFAPVDDIEHGMADVENVLKASENLRTVREDKYPDALARVYASVNQIHPFRDGNGRTQRIWISELATQSRHHVDWSKAYREQNDVACQLANESRDYTELTKMFRTITKAEHPTHVRVTDLELAATHWPVYPIERERLRQAASISPGDHREGGSRRVMTAAQTAAQRTRIGAQAVSDSPWPDYPTERDRMHTALPSQSPERRDPPSRTAPRRVREI